MLKQNILYIFEPNIMSLFIPLSYESNGASKLIHVIPYGLVETVITKRKHHEQIDNKVVNAS